MKTEITDADMDDMIKFGKTPDSKLSFHGLALRARTMNACTLYKSLSKGPLKKVVESSSGFLPGKDKFLDNFIQCYNENKNQFRDSLILSLMQAYVSKMSGHQNPAYGVKVINFMLGLVAAGHKQAFEYISGNLNLVSLQQIRSVMSQRRSEYIFINTTSDQALSMLGKQFEKVRTKSNDSNMRISFSVGIDATALVKCYQLMSHHEAIVGGAYPNHFISVKDRNEEEIATILKKWCSGVYGEIASEIKVAVISFQNTPPGISPYFIFMGRPQTINEQNDFGREVVTICQTAARLDGNAAFLNESTDGVSCEVAFNKELTIQYLKGLIDYISLTDPNHNFKNGRGQMIGGSCPVSIGTYVFNPYLLKLAGTTTELY